MMVRQKAGDSGSTAPILVLVLVLTLPALPRASAQARQQAPTEPLQYDVSVTLKLIPVHVIDKSGQPIRDLTKDEFTITDNGKPVIISAFEKHELAAAPSGVETPVPAVTARSYTAPSQILNRRFILFFDFAFNTGHGIVASVAAARHFLQTEVRPGDEIALISYSMLRGLRVHEFLTTDHSKILAALSAITSREIVGRADEVEQAYWMMADMNFKDKDVVPNMEAQRRESAQQARGYFEALARLADALRLVQGEKNILFFSSGVPSSLVNSGRRAVTADPRIVESISQQSTGSTFDIPNSELRAFQEDMLKELSAANCSVYSFDTRESAKLPALYTFDETISQNRPMGGLLLGADSGGIFRDDKTTGMDSLRRLSRQTGGKYYSNIALHEKNLEEVSAVTGTYYVLGYSIPAASDGQFHKIRVEVSRKGCQVRTQPGYFNPKPFREYTEIEKNIHLFDLALNEKSELQTPKLLPVSALSYDMGQGPRIRALARISRDVWQQFQGRTAEIVALFFDPQDSLLSLQRVAVPVADYRGTDVLFSAATSARPGTTKCRIVIRDLDTGQSAVASTTAFSGPSRGQFLSVFSPLLVAEGGGFFFLEGVVKGAAETPSWRGLYGYDATKLSPVIGDEPVGAGKIEVILPFSAPGLDASALSFKTNLVNSGTGESLDVPLELKELTKSGAIAAQKIEISPDQIPNGKYLLYVHVGNRADGQVVSARVPLTIGR
jgi:VWFA-related protein